MESKVPKYNKTFKDLGKGTYDEAGFYNSESGSFIDPDGYYFNRHGFDVKGGYYDDNGNYINPALDNYEDEDDGFDDDFNQIEQNLDDEAYYNEDELAYEDIETEFKNVNLNSNTNTGVKKIETKNDIKVTKSSENNQKIIEVAIPQVTVTKGTNPLDNIFKKKPENNGISNPPKIVSTVKTNTNSKPQSFPNKTSK